MEHSHSGTLNKKGHAVSAITDGVNKVGSRLGLLKKKKSEEEKNDEFVTKPVNDKQEADQGEPISLNPQVNPSANHVKEEQKLEQTNGIKPYNVDFKDNPKQEEENKESATRNIEFKESESPSRKPDEGSRSSEETGNNNRFSTYGSNRLSTYGINHSGEIVGTLTITVVEAKNLIPVSDGGKTSNSYVKVKLNSKKEVLKTSVVKKSTSPEWNERVTLKVTGSPVSFLFCVRDRNLLSKDIELGEYELHLWDHIKDENIKDMWVTLSKGTNSQLHIKLDFVPSEQNSSGEQVNLTNGGNGITSKRTSGDNDRDNGLGFKFSIRKKK